MERQLPPIQEPAPQPAQADSSSNPVSTPKKASIPNDLENKENRAVTPTTEERKKTKSEKRAERFVENHARKPKRQTNGPQQQPKPNRGPGDPRRSQGQRQSSGKVITTLSGGNGKIVLFMPFLHYETDRRRRRLADAIKRFRLENLGHTSKRIGTDEDRELPKSQGPVTRDDLLVHAYLNHSPSTAYSKDPRPVLLSWH